MKNKIDKDTALARIKVLIDKYYEDVGREIFDDIDMERINLIDSIEEVLEQVDIETKNIIVEKLRLDEVGKERVVDEKERDIEEFEDLFK